MSKSKEVRVWKFMQKSIQINGLDRTFPPGSDWSWVEDPEFQKLLRYHHQYRDLLENYIRLQVEDWSKRNQPG